MNKINKITLRGKAKIIEEDENKFVIKKNSKNLSSLFDYLSNRGFSNFPNIVSEDRDSTKYEYINSDKYSDIEKENKLIRVVSDLHYKTTYYKTVSRHKYKEIYNKLIDNVDYLKDYYNKLITNIDNERYMSPSSYLFARNYSVIMANLYYIEKELNSWYNLVKDKTKQRVVVVHNNLRIDNFISGSKDVLTGWDNYLVDTPVLDIYKLYKNEYKNIDVSSLLKEYNEIYKLSEDEMKLFNILISLPLKIDIDSNEFNNVKNIKKMLDYTYATSEFIKLKIFN